MADSAPAAAAAAAAPEKAAAAAAPAAADSKTADKPSNVVQVSLRFRVFRFVSAARKLLREGQDTVELTGIGNAITSVVSAAEILRNGKYVDFVKLQTSLVAVDGAAGSSVQVPKLSVVMKKGSNFDSADAEQLKVEAERAAARETAKQEEK